MEDNGKKRYGGAYNPNRFNALDSALAYLIVLLAFYFVPLVVSALFKAFFKALYDYDYYAYMLASILLSQAIVFVVAFIVAKVRRAEPFDGGGYKARFDGVEFLMGMVLIMGVMMTFYYAHLRFSDDAEKMVGSFFPSNVNESALSGLFALIYLLLIAVLPALIEEMMFRGVIMRGLEQFGAIPAIILSSVAFSLMHGSFSQTLLQFIGGVAIASAVILTRNWLLGSVMHFFNNLFSGVFTLLISEELFESPLLYYVPFVADAACIIIGVVCLAIGVIYFGKLAVKRKTDEALGKEFKIKSYGKEKNYVETVGDEISFSPYYRQVPLSSKKEDGGKKYYICGKFRKMNSYADPVAAAISMVVAFIIAVAMMFI